MKPKTTLFLLLLAAAAFIFVKIYEARVPSTREAKEQQGRVLTEFNRSKIKRVEIKNADTTIALERDEEGEWEMDEPVKDRADNDALTRLFTAMELLRGKATIQRPTDDQMRDFDLRHPKISVKLEGGDSPTEILFGSDTAVGEQGYYVKLAKDAPAYVVEGDLKSQVSQKADAFRARDLIGRPATDVERVVLKTKAGEIEAVKEGQDWKLVRPFKARGDDEKIRDLIARIANVRIDSFVDAGKDAQAHGFAEPAGSVQLFFHDEEKPVEVTFGESVAAEPAGPAATPAPEATQVHARVSTRNGVFVVPAPVKEVLTLQPNDVRDRSLVRLNPDIVDRVKIAPAGAEPIVLARKEEEWAIKSAGDAPANTAEANGLLDLIRNQKITAFVSDVASELQKYGLQKPQLEITFSSYASGNTAESQAGENEIATVFFGRADGSVVYAKLTDEPFIVSVDKSLLEKIPVHDTLWRSPQVTDLDPISIRKVEITRGGQTVVLERPENGAWQSPAGTVQEVPVQSLVNTLARLRAVRWIWPPPQAQKLQPPQISASFTTSDGTVRTLQIGASNAEEMWFARMSAADAVFLMSNPDHETLEASLVTPPAADAPASPRPQ